MSAASANTLFITFDGICDPLGQSQILPYLTGIASSGYRITIISCEKRSRFEKENHKINEILAKHNISWHFIYYDEEGGFFSRWKYVQQVKQLALKTCLEKDISLVHCRSYLSALAGLMLKRKKNIPFVFDMRGFWADERIDGGIWKKNHPLQLLAYRYFKYSEQLFLKEAAAIVSLTENAKEHLIRNFKLLPLNGKIRVIPCCVDVELFDPDKTSNSEKIAFSASEHVIIYTGSIGTWYYTKELIDCMLVWKKSIPHLRLLFVTRDMNALEEILKKYPDDTRSFISMLSASYEEMPSLLKLAKASVFFIKPSFSKIASSPTKMAECWSMNLPIITNAGIGDNDRYFQDNLGGVLLKDFDKLNYQKACEDYLKLEKGKFRQIAIEHFNKEMAVKEYTRIYSTIIDNS